MAITIWQTNTCGTPYFKELKETDLPIETLILQGIRPSVDSISEEPSLSELLPQYWGQLPENRSTSASLLTALQKLQKGQK
jgi:hypothetical protein